MDRAYSSVGKHVAGHQQNADYGSPEPTIGQKRKRTRASRACDTCHARKVKCNEQNPCSNCLRKISVKTKCLQLIGQQITCRYGGGVVADPSYGRYELQQLIS